jgi:Family of unknown function (DUF5996)
MTALPPMPEDWEDTRATLQAYASVVSALPRGLLEPDPRWWHIGFSVTPRGFQTLPISISGGASATLLIDLVDHEIVLSTDTGSRLSWPMDAGITATKMGDELIAAATEFGLDGRYDLDSIADDAPRPYDRADAERFFSVLQAVHAVFVEHRSRLDGDVSPIHLWPHGFDLSFEWFGTKLNPYEENGRVVELPSQLSLGFYPAGDAYFYSNPWPFDVDLMIENPLPEACEWYVSDWQGTRLRYAALDGDPRATERLLDFAERVFEIVRPTLSD